MLRLLFALLAALTGLAATSGAVEARVLPANPSDLGATEQRAPPDRAAIAIGPVRRISIPALAPPANDAPAAPAIHVATVRVGADRARE